MVQIVSYKTAHQNGIDTMMQEIALEFGEHIFSKPTKQTPILPDNYWVALHNKKVIGTVGVLVVKNNIGILKKMMLKKKYRGKEFGISKLLLDTVIKWSKTANISAIYLGTMQQFKAAQVFYERNGFEKIPEYELPSNFLKNPLDTVFFKLNLKD
jgi:N-acetylglutamate synthase-like GNAT family acetyltransferase